MNLRNKTALVIDQGYFISVALKLAETFSRVYYYVPSEGTFKTNERHMIGSGLPGLIKVDDPDKYVDEVDLIVYTDLGEGGRVAWLRKHGYRVFGCGYGERLERDRKFFNDMIKKQGLPLIPSRKVVGIDALKKDMQSHKDTWIKISDFRGLAETQHNESFEQSEEWYYKIAHKLGAERNTFEFTVQDSVPGIEIGADGFFSQGRMLSPCLQGLEIKDHGYVGKVIDYRSLPAPVLETYDGLAPVMEDLDVRGSIVTEVRITPKGIGYPIDATQRFASPPGALMTEMWENFAEIIWCVAGDEPVEPIPAARYGAEIILYSGNAPKEWVKISYPESIKQWIKLKNLCLVDDEYVFVPQADGDIIGSAIGIGNTLEEATTEAMANAEQVECAGYRWDETVWDTADEKIAEAKKVGIRF